MFPPGHLALGYLLFSGYVHARYSRTPRGIEAIFVGFGSLLPDLIDKPLAWYGVFPDGRYATHSFLVATLFIGIVGLISVVWLGDTDPAVAFGLSYVSHSLADGLPMFIEGDFAGDFEEVSFWFWPFGDPSGKLADSSINASVTHAKGEIGSHLWMSNLMEVRPFLMVFELAVVFLAITVWLLDGRPGWSLIRPTRSK